MAAPRGILRRRGWSPAAGPPFGDPPYSLSFLVRWTLFFLLWWALGIPLGLGAG